MASRKQGNRVIGAKIKNYREAVRRFEEVKRITVAAGIEPGKATTIAARLGGDWSVVYWSALANMSTTGFILCFGHKISKQELRDIREEVIAGMENVG